MIFVSNVVRFPMLSSMIIVQCCPMLSNIIIVQCSGAFLEAAVGGWTEAGGKGAGSKVQNHQKDQNPFHDQHHQNHHHQQDDHHLDITLQAGENGAKPLLSPG